MRLAPALRPKALRTFVAFAQRIALAQRAAQRDFVAEMLAQRRDARALRDVARSEDRARLYAALLVLADLSRHGWRVRVADDVVQVTKPAGHVDAMDEKVRVRAQLNVERDEQLRGDAAREFIRSMERRRVWNSRSVSIFSLMRDGEELARRLEDARRAPRGPMRLRALTSAVRPYVQIVTDGARCDHTGYRLQDVWRYFRHTWASPHRSIPGRSMMVLVRDAAAEFHPVIGIAAISSATVQINKRDVWIGWSSDVLVEALRANPSDEAAQWIQGIVDGAVDELHLDDLLEDGVILPGELRQPTPEMLARLDAEAAAKRKLHQRNASGEMKHTTGSGREYWVARARSYLFRSKRAETLASLMRARIALLSGKRFRGKALAALLETSEGRRRVRSIVRKAKSDRVGTAIADITVCGAVAPYNALLGGKLVAMLVASPEVIAGYRARYSRMCSVIASSMAGRPIIRPSELVLLGTTSYYTASSSQYNRVKIPCARAGGREGEKLEYKELGPTAGYGTIQFGIDTAAALQQLTSQSNDGQRVNSLFGEGTNPRMRKVREGLDLLSLPADYLLQHGSPRMVYGVALARNFREYLLGRAHEPEYLLPQDDLAARTADIAGWWAERWLSGRIESDEVLAAVSGQRLVHPIRHGARVVTPTEETDQLDLGGWQ